MILCDHSRRAACAAALLLTALVSSAHAQSGRTLTWQFGNQGASVTDGDPGDLNPQPLWLSMPFSVTGAGGTITGIVNGGYIAGIGAEMVQLTSCTIRGDIGGFADQLIISYSFADAPIPFPYAGASLNGRYFKAAAPGGAGTIALADIDIQCHLNGDPTTHASARGRPYSGPGPVPFWDLEIRTTTGIQVCTSVMGIIPFRLGALNDAIFLPNSAEAFASPNDAYRQSPLTTLFAANQSGAIDGVNTFDLTVYRQLTITSLDVNSSSPAGTSGMVSVDVCPISRVGREETAFGWDAVSSGSFNTAPFNTPTACPLNPPIVLEPGTYGIRLKASNIRLAYTIGTGANQIYLNGDLMLSAGCAQNTLYGPVISPRVVNTSIHYTTVPGYASWSTFGNGCNQGSATFYEHFATAPSFDLANSSMRLTHLGDRYRAGHGGSYVAPSAAATVLTLSDDSEVTVSLAAPFPYLGSSTGSLNICSNGYVSVGGGTGSPFLPSLGTWLNNYGPRWGSWHDYNPAAGGQVKFEQLAGIAYVTWDGVADYGVPGSSSTWQLQFDTSTGNVTYVWRNMSLTGNGHLVGFSAGGTSDITGRHELSADLPGTFVTANQEGPLGLFIAPYTRPLVGSAIQLGAWSLPGNSYVSANVLGLSRYDPGIDLSALGMPNCTQYVVPMSTLFGQLRTLYIPNDPALAGIDVFSQSVAFAPGANALGVVASNGLRLHLGY